MLRKLLHSLERFSFLFLHFYLVPMVIFLGVVALLVLLTSCTAGAPPPKIDFPKPEATQPYSLQTNEKPARTDVDIIEPTDKAMIGVILFWREGRTQHLADGAVAIHRDKRYVEWLQDGYQYRTNRPGLYQFVPYMKLEGPKEEPKDSPKGRIVHNIKAWDYTDELVVNVNIEGVDVVDITADGRIQWKRTWIESGEQLQASYGTLPNATWLIVSYYLRDDVPITYEPKGN